MAEESMNVFIDNVHGLYCDSVKNDELYLYQQEHKINI